MYVKKIDNASTSELRKTFEKHIRAAFRSQDSKVLTDRWKGDTPLAELYNIMQEKCSQIPIGRRTA
jgi:hypothetical protein